MTITPGTDTALVFRSALLGSKKRIFSTIAGICSGLLVHATLSSFGLSAILQTSPQLYTAVKTIGACYLIYLGICALNVAIKLKTSAVEGSPISEVTFQESVAIDFRTGLLTNVLNPKVAVFYLTFIPQFIDPSKNVLLQALALSGGHILMSIVWLLLIGFFVGYFKPQLEKPKVKMTIEILTGLAFIGFGIRLVL